MDPTPPPPSSEPPPTTTTPPITTTSSTTSPEQPPPQQPQPIPTTTSTSSLQQQQQQPLPPSSLNPNPNPKLPNPQVSQPLQPPQPINPMLRTPFNRPWQQNTPPFPHFSSITNHSTAPSSSLAAIPPAQRGGMAIGVPAHGPPSPQPPTSFSSLTPSFGSQFGGLGRTGSVTVPESVTSTSTAQVRQSMSGMMGSLGSSSSLRPSGVAASHPQRPLQSSLRPQTGANNQSAAAQNFQEHGLLRLPSAGSPGSAAPTTPQTPQPHNQPWLSSGSQGKPPLPPPSFRPQISPQSLQQRSHLPSQQQQQPSTMSTPPTQQQPQTTSSSLQSQPSSLSQQQPQEHYALPPSRVPQTLSHQQQLARNRGLGNQRPFAPPALGQSSPAAPPPAFNRTPAVVEASEPCNRIISKRSIQEIVAQIDPAERLDPEVEDILVDIADEFVESVTTFACSLAKHRKSNTLESKDILLHLERNWNMSLPGFGGDEIKCYKKPFANDIHRERVAAIKKSIGAAEASSNSKSSGGQAGGGAKGHPAKAPAVVIGSPNPKARDAT